MGDITFAGGWDSNDNNVTIYPDQPGRYQCASKREIIVILKRLPQARIYCHHSESGRIRDFVGFVDDPAVPLQVDKGIHADSWSRTLGLHLSVVVTGGFASGNKFHLYGQRFREGNSHFGEMCRTGAWAVDVITEYTPKRDYRWGNLQMLQQGAAPSPPIVVFSSGVPKAAEGSQAELDQLRVPGW